MCTSVVSPGKRRSHFCFPNFLQANAYITTKEGKLSNNFKYLDSLMKHASKQIEDVDQNNSMVIMLQGHLFDSGLINQVLDILDADNCGFEFKQCHVRHKEKDDLPVKSSAMLEIVCDKDTDLFKVESKIEKLVMAIESAEATFRRIDRPGNSKSEKASFRPATVESLEDKKVLLLGAGRVSKSVVDFLGRSENRTIIVASNDENEAREVASHAKRARHSCFDVGNDQAQLSRLVKDADVVISLLPVPMHPRVAQMCIQNGKDLVTASYESPDMRKLGERYVFYSFRSAGQRRSTSSHMFAVL
jgi:alpha-aminoadipic semialdehyde synthase